MKIKSIAWDNRQITKPGVYEGIPLDLYHDPGICVGPSISSSGLREIFGDKKSPAHFYAKWRGNPNREEPDGEPRHFILGRAVHHLILGEKFFSKMFVLRPEYISDPDIEGVEHRWNAHRTECKKWMAERLKEGRTWLTVKEVKAIRQMAISIGNHPITKHGGFNGLIERSIFWKDKETGIWLKSRPDAIPTDSADFVDLKTIHSIFEVRKHVERFGYHRQIALAREGARIVLDAPMASFTLLFVESKPPYDTKDVECVTRDIDDGELENRAAIRLFAKCLKDKKWPGIGDDVGVGNKVERDDETRERAHKRLSYHGIET